MCNNDVKGLPDPAHNTMKSMKYDIAWYAKKLHVASITEARGVCDIKTGKRVYIGNCKMIFVLSKVKVWKLKDKKENDQLKSGSFSRFPLK